MSTSVRRRRKLAGTVVAAVVVSAAGGWIAASHIRSPAEVAAQTAAPEASAILVPAEERTISTDVVTRGTARFGSSQQLSAAPSALKPTAGIVTKLPAPGTQLAEGDVALTATGRPIFLLAGDRLGVRDLGPGLVGEDVRQLEEALQRLGFEPGNVDQSYGAATEAAVSRWYEAAGYAPFRATEEQLAAIRTAEADLATARVDQHNARDSVATAEADLVAARAARADAIATRGLNASTVSAAEAEARAGNEAAQAEVAAKTAALDELLAAGDASPSAVATARAELAAAHANAESAQQAGGKLVAEARVAASAADNAVGAADASARAAETKLSDARAAVGDQGIFAGVRAQEAGLAKRHAGVQVPADEVIFVRSVPVRVNELSVAIGDQLNGPVMTTTDAVVAVDGALPLEDAPLVEIGMTVQIDEPDLNISATGRVSQVAPSPGTNGADGFHIWFEVIVDGAPANVVGTSLRLTLPVESTAGTVLAVPTSAVSLAADGTSRVERDDNGTRSFVQVEPGLSADGFVEITPVGGTLKAGDMVVVGVKEASSAPGN